MANGLTQLANNVLYKWVLTDPISLSLRQVTAAREHYYPLSKNYIQSYKNDEWVGALFKCEALRKKRRKARVFLHKPLVQHEAEPSLQEQHM